MADGQNSTAFDQAAQVPDVPKDKREALWGIAGSLTGNKPGSQLEQAIAQHHQQRLDEARMHKRTASQAAGIVTAINASMKKADADAPFGRDHTGKPFASKEEAQQAIQQYTNEWNSAMDAFAKVAGVNKQTKAAIQQSRQKAEMIMSGQMQPPQKQDAQGGAAAPPPVPQAGGAAPSPAAGAAPGPGGGGPPQIPLAAELPFRYEQMQQQQADQHALQFRKAQYQQDIDVRKEQAEEMVKAGVWKKGSPDYNEYVYQIKHPAGSGKPPTPKLYKNKNDEPFMGIPNAEGQIVDVDTGEVVSGALSAGGGEFSEHQWTYADDKGEPHPALRIGSKMVDAFTKQPLKPGTKVFYAWIAPRTTDTWTPKFVQQPDGSTKYVGQVETVSVRKPGMPGGTPAPSAAPDAAPSKAQATSGGGAAPPSAPKKPSGGAGFRNPKPGDTVGGKTPPGVAKAYEQYRGSVTRQRVMEDALPLAIGGDQQAMINLLYNHIGMTTGLQKGARMSQELIKDAEKSRGMVSGLESKLNYTKDPQTGEMVFNWDDPIREGTTLTVPQMKQMVSLAADRSKQEKQAWLDEIGAAKKGYGMTGDVPDVPSPDKAALSGAAPKTADEFFKKKGIAPH